MRVLGHYEPNQDRMLLRMWRIGSTEQRVVWLTRRHWLHLAFACGRARSSTASISKAAAARKSANVSKPEVANSAAGPLGVARPGLSQDSRTGSSPTPLASGIKFRRIPQGLRIEILIEASPPIVLALKGRSLLAFVDMVDRLADKAKWDLPAALARMNLQAVSQRRTLH